jgi:hypothetical protein
MVNHPGGLTIYGKNLTTPLTYVSVSDRDSRDNRDYIIPFNREIIPSGKRRSACCKWKRNTATLQNLPGAPQIRTSKRRIAAAKAYVQPQPVLTVPPFELSLGAQEMLGIL